MSEHKKKKKKELVYDIDPNLPEAEQRKLRKKIRAEKRAAREARRKARAEKATAVEPAKKAKHERQPERPQTHDEEEEEVGAAPVVAVQKPVVQSVTSTPKEEPDVSHDYNDAPGDADTHEDSGPKSSMALARERAQAAIRADEEKAAEQQRIAERQQMLRQLSPEDLAELKAKEKVERKKRQREEAARLLAHEREKEEQEKMERQRREAEEREAERKRKMEIEKKRREQEERELMERRKREREEWDRMREQRLKETKARQKEDEENRLKEMSEADREALERREEQRWRREELRQREKQKWAEQQRLAVEEVHSKFDSVMASLRLVDRASSKQRAEDAGKTSNEWMYKELTMQHLYAHNSIAQLANHAEFELGVPEIEIRGIDNYSKGLIVDAILGFSLCRGNTLRRPVEIHLIQDMTQEFAPLIKFSSDSEYDAKEVQVFEMAKELKKRAVTASEEPVVIHFHYKLSWDVSILLFTEDELDEPAGQDAIVLWVAPLFEEVDSRVLGAMKELSGSPLSTILVFTGFLGQTANMAFAQELNALLMRSFPTVDHVYYTSPAVSQVDRTSLTARHAKEQEALRHLHAKKTLENRVGLPRLLSLVQDLTAQMYESKYIPEFLAHFEESLETLREREKTVIDRLESMTSEKMRGVGSAYFVNYVRAFSHGLRGAVRGDAANNGQTAADEWFWSGEWTTGLKEAVPLSPSDFLGGSEKLYGTAQFTRLMREFRLVMERANFKDFSSDVAANGAPGGGKAPLADFASASGDIAQKRLQFMLKPLLDTLLQRAVDIARRCTLVARTILHHYTGGVRYPQLLALLDATTKDFVEVQSKRAAKIMEDQLRSTRVFVWDFENEPTHGLINGQNGEMKLLRRLAAQSLEDVKERVAASAQMQLYEDFWLPLEKQLPQYVMAKLAELDNEDVATKLDMDSQRTALLVEKATIAQTKILHEQYLKHARIAVNDMSWCM